MSAQCSLWTMFILVGILIAGTATATTYYVAPKGADSNPGTLRAPFQTIQHAAAIMKPGDVCKVREGTYRETVRPPRSGAEGGPIVFEAYKNEKVVLNGADPITGWQAAEGKVFRAAVDGPVEQVFVDGQMMTEARWPNSPRDPMKPVKAVAAAGSGPNTISDPQLPPGDLNGARVCILPGAHWVSWTRTVKDYDPAKHAFNFEGNWGQDAAHAVKQGTLYYLFGHEALLDAPGEWYFDAVGKTISLWLPDGDDPGKHRIEIKRRLWAFDLSKLHCIQVKGFRVFASTITMPDASYCVVEKCHVRYASHFTNCEGWAGRNDTGIVIGGRHNVVRDCSVIYSAGNGVTLLGENNAVTNCEIGNVDYAEIDCAAVWAEGKDNEISHNSLHDTGRSVVVHRTLKHGRIEYNDMYNAGLLTTDLGITYCFQTDGAGTIIAYNWVHDNKAKECGVGIYIDNGSSNFLIHHNVSWNNGNSGIRLNTPSHNNFVYNNTVLNNGDSVHYWGPDNNKDQAGCKLTNNIFTNKVVTGDGIEVDHNYTGADPGIVSIEKRDFRLKKGSPCIDAGIPVEGVTDDFKGKAPDLGAYEYGVRRAWRAGHDPNRVISWK